MFALSSLHIMFVTVRYGDEQEQIFNPDCRNEIFLHCIKEHCRCPSEETVELSDEMGEVKHLRRYPHDYAKDFLKDRETLILLKVTHTGVPVTEDHAMDKATFTPMLSSLISNSDFIDLLNPSKAEDNLSEGSAKSSRRRSSTFDTEEFKSSKSKAKSTSAGKKPTSRRGQRPPLRKSNNTS